MWRSKYDMAPDDFSKELDRLWEQVRPLYLSLHAYVRTKLREKYGDVVPASGPIPAYLLGNMWAQDWDNIYPLVQPANAVPFVQQSGIIYPGGADTTLQVTSTLYGLNGQPNTFFIDESGTVITRQVDHSILRGITRTTLIEIIAAHGLRLEERKFGLDEAFRAREAFITGATTLVMPVVAIDGHKIGGGAPGPVTLKLRHIFHDAAARST